MTQARITCALLVLSLWGCRGCEEPPPGLPPEAPAPDAGAIVDGPCLKWTAEARRVGTVPEALQELSGLVASRRHEGIFWAHNDSGHAPELFAIRESGEVVARFLLEGVSPLDVEDVALGPCVADAARTCVVLADIGDNLKRRAFVQLIEVEEPEVLADGSLPALAYPFRYPDGPVDAESLVIDPITGAPHVLTKEWDHLGGVYRLDALGAEESEAVLVGTLAPGGEARFATAADVSHDGSRLLVRTYSGVWEVRGGPGAQPVELLMRGRAIPVTSAPQPQSEAIAYLPDGRGYLVGTEGAGEGLFRIDCRD